MIYEGIDRWNSPYIEHHGVKGMKWGVRKAQNDQKRLLRRTQKYLNSLEEAKGRDSYSSAASTYRRQKRRLFKETAKYTKRYGDDSVSYKSGVTKEGKAYMDVMFKNGASTRVVSKLPNDPLSKLGRKTVLKARVIR